jgi:hypothetical protein
MVMPSLCAIRLCEVTLSPLREWTLSRVSGEEDCHSNKEVSPMKGRPWSAEETLAIVLEGIKEPSRWPRSAVSIRLPDSVLPPVENNIV